MLININLNVSAIEVKLDETENSCVNETNEKFTFWEKLSHGCLFTLNQISVLIMGGFNSAPKCCSLLDWCSLSLNKVLNQVLNTKFKKEIQIIMLGSNLFLIINNLFLIIVSNCLPKIGNAELILVLGCLSGIMGQRCTYSSTDLADKLKRIHLYNFS